MEHGGIEYFQNKGRELGYKDEELRSYVKEQCDIERDERERERSKPENLKKDEEIKR